MPGSLAQNDKINPTSSINAVVIMCVIKFCGCALRQLAVAWLGWRTRRQVEQGATDVAAGAGPGRTQAHGQASAARRGYRRARWRRVSDLRSTSAVATAKVHRSFAGTG